jgi:DNA-binding transcriptional LysR family regulator
MELKHLRYFRSAVEEGSLQGAAARLSVAQPALSRRVRDLEAQLGCQLLVRGAHGVVPTPAGLVLYRDTVRLLGELDDTIQRVGRMGLEQGRGVRMGLAPTVARKYSFLASALASFAARRQDSGIAFRRGPSSELVEGLKEGAVDLALLYEQRPDSSRIADRLVHRESYVLAIHPDHPLAVSGPADLIELAGQPLIWLARSDIADSVNPMSLQLRRHGLEPAIAQVVDSPDVQLDFTMASGGLCLTPASTMLALPPGKLHFRALPRFDATMDLTLAWARESAGEQLLVLVNLLQDAIDDHQTAIAGGSEAWMSLDGYPQYHVPQGG